MNQFAAIYKAVLEGDAPAAKAGVEAALKAGATADQMMQQGLIAAMREVGRPF